MNTFVRRPAGVSAIGRRAFARRSPARRDAIIGYLFLVPLLAGLLVFRFYGFVYNVWLSFMNAGAFGAPKFTGLANYQKLLTDDQLGLALINTVKFAAIAVPAVVVVSLLLALLMQNRFRGESVFRAIIFLPAVCLPSAMILVFAWMFQTQYGIVNALIQAMGASPVSWFGSAAGVTFIISLLVVYLSFSVPTIILYAGLQDVPADLHEAAKLDGAGAVSRFFYITLPMLTPSLFFVIITTTIGVLKLFDVVYVLLGPVDSVSLNYGFTIVYYYYYAAFIEIGQRGYAAAISLFLLLLILAVSLVLLRLQRRFTHYGENG